MVFKELRHDGKYAACGFTVAITAGRNPEQNCCVNHLSCSALDVRWEGKPWFVRAFEESGGLMGRRPLYVNLEWGCFRVAQGSGSGGCSIKPTGSDVILIEYGPGVSAGNHAERCQGSPERSNFIKGGRARFQNHDHGKFLFEVERCPRFSFMRVNAIHMKLQLLRT